MYVYMYIYMYIYIYITGVAFHNSTHATDVLQATPETRNHKTVTVTGLLEHASHLKGRGLRTRPTCCRPENPTPIL